MLLKVVQLVLGALLLLLERRTVAAERQAEYTERQYTLLRQYLGYSDPTFAEVLEGRATAAELELSEPPDVYSEEGASRDLKAERLEQLKVLWFGQHGEVLDDERLIEEYDRLYTEAETRVAQLDPDVSARVQ